LAIVPEFIIKGGLVKTKIRINNVSSHCTSCARVETLDAATIVGINSSLMHLRPVLLTRFRSITGCFASREMDPRASSLLDAW
jgi:hypothetical protein